ncbi:helix-turn-helix transcriptional regulator [Priestia megaterium]|jgi:putative transcriptional regulator|uniref:helix-turn-helix transcriptional regulator n=1 Tax=Priestia megaterium TaxID=1404 RepID=UPI00203DCA01|nr:helix-turn-helix transcriptional regulator [Priestia megaterium]MCM3196329.1 helix-turn-helix domain-containing protein [Priestia megaterium]MCY9017228.1 helix-turn-helix domain-containing protein [Priestia megaterium]MDP1383007.1 helix-turn-helix transcriptional regulator [Priestia megaterium]MDP1426947.1 helix-turn-helix transcriptional regulator [Priestia megaterium]MDP1441942.1 helix-turn-helix transcriptional regulator [Priestia megaterium]
MSLQKLKQARKAKGLSQTFMAKKLGYTYPSGYANIETGRNKLSLENAKKIADILQMDVNELFFGEELHETGK